MATQQDSEIPQASKPKILPDSVLDSEEPALRKKQAVMEWLLGKIKKIFFFQKIFSTKYLYSVTKNFVKSICIERGYYISLTPFLSTYFL